MDSVDKYGSEEQQLQRIIDALVPVFQSIIDAIVPVIEHCSDELIRMWDAVLKAHPDKHVVWLAFHHKKAKVRKKNRKRIVRYIKKAVKCDDQAGTESVL